MSGLDPTIAASTIAAGADPWSVEDIAAMQAEIAEALVEPDPVLADGYAEQPPAARAPQLAADVQRSLVSGRYRAVGQVELELRIDVDGVRPTRRVSGDFYRRSGATLFYEGSFVIASPRIRVLAASIVIDGRGVFSFQSNAPRLRITIPRVPASAARPPATAQFLTSTGQPGANFACQFESRFFRTVEFERDMVVGVEPFQSHDTARLPSGGPNRVLTVAAAYAEAGIEMIDTGFANRLPIQLAGGDLMWTNSELHAAMTVQFSRWTRDPEWRVWVLAATMHEEGAGLRGIMFNSDKRQGCAVFHNVVGSGVGAADTVNRAMLRTYVHELGHCFNLYHSFHKVHMSPPLPNRLDALSWMHYPDSYRSGNVSGAGAYWQAFPFQFDDDELAHLRHGFRNNVIPGGNEFGIGAADIDPNLFGNPVHDESGLSLELRAPATSLLGTPVVVELKLSLTDRRGRSVNSLLHPKHGFTTIAITKMSGQPVRFRPLLTQCADPVLVTLDDATPAIYDSAYIGYGKDGHHFDAPGNYEVVAAYDAPEGSRVLSNRLRLRVTSPLDRADGELAELFLGDDQGQLLYLLGSDSKALQSGNDALELAIDKHAAHPMTAYARLVEGFNASRRFKTLDDGKVSVRPSNPTRAIDLLSKVTASKLSPSTYAASDGSTAGADVPSLDNISLNMAMCKLAEVQRAAGDADKGVRTMQSMVDYFRNEQKVPAHIGAALDSQLRAYSTDVSNSIGEGGDQPAPRPPRTRRKPRLAAKPTMK